MNTHVAVVLVLLLFGVAVVAATEITLKEPTPYPVSITELSTSHDGVATTYYLSPDPLDPHKTVITGMVTIKIIGER